MSENSRAVPRILVIEHEPHAGPGRLGDFDGADLDRRRPDLGEELPADLSGYDAFVVLGGSMAAWEDDAAPWLPSTRRLLAQAVHDQMPTLGICLGAQLLAMATGGAVGRGDAGLEVGLVEITTTDAAASDPFFAGVTQQVGSQFGAAQWHQDAVLALPPGSVLLATGERYPHQAFRIGEKAWGVQYHPEVTKADWDDWMETYHGALHPEGLDRHVVDAGVQGAQGELDALARAHVASFVGVLTDD